MGLPSYLRSVLHNLLYRNDVDARLDAEIRSYADLLADEKIAAGMSPAEARRAALAEAGGIEPIKQAVRDRRAGIGFEVVAQDLRYGLRQLRRSRGFAALVILTLAVGIGANTAICSFVNSVLLRPLPYPDANRLVILLAAFGNASRAPVSRFELFQIRQHAQQMDQVAGIWTTNGDLPGDGTAENNAEQIKVGVITSNFLQLLTPRPALGRFFSREDDDAQFVSQPGAQPIIISHALWARRFGSNPTIIGRAIRFNRGSAIVVGVLLENFRILFPHDSNIPANLDVFTDVPIDSSEPTGPEFLHLLGRVRPGSNAARAQQDMNAVSVQINTLAAKTTVSNFSLAVYPLQEDDVREVRSTLLLLFGGVAFVLLIGCANIANLLMVRARHRLRETTIRAALGASRARLVRQFLTENLLLASLGAVAALGVGWAAVHAILAARPPSFTNFNQVALDDRVLAFTFAVAFLTSALFSLAPVLAVRRLDLTRNLKDASRQSGWRRRHWTSFLVSAEVALAFVLLLGTGLLMRTFVNILRADPGFHVENVYAFRISRPGWPMLHQLQQSLSALPGVQSVAAVSHLPLDDAGNWYDYYWKEGAPIDQQNTVMADDRSIMPGYFTTIGSTLIAGRDFTDSDDASHLHVAVIDDVLAHQLWPAGDALGKKLNISDSPDGPYQFQRDWVVIVGIVRHIQCHSLTAIVRPQVYVPFQLAPRPMSVVVRSSGVVPGLASVAQKQVSLLNKDLAVSHVEPLTTLVARAQAESRFASLLATLLSAVALLLASIGIYGVLSYSVAQRTTEIGIRMAIGAPRAQVLKMILADGFAWVLPGLAAGFLLSLAVTPLLERLLFGVKPGNAANYAVILIGVLIVSALAALLPARRAMKIDPLTALRCE
ncbi:MAG TPA: ABC transporter permease [Acidobacteriaceae bacterium]|jgi:putative ABC transport system permease protein|nr:ABC transporter permease [Acidobacteriaceae bacterium]